MRQEYLAQRNKLLGRDLVCVQDSIIHRMMNVWRYIITARPFGVSNKIKNATEQTTVGQGHL